MPPAKQDRLHILNIIRRAMVLVGSLKATGADTGRAESLIKEAKEAADAEQYEKALSLAKDSMLEVMRLKTELEAGRPAGQPQGAQSDSAPGQADAQPPPAAPVRAGPAPQAQDGAMPEIMPSFSYLVVEDRVNKCFKLMERQLGQAGVKGLCISRTNPKQLRRLYAYPEATVKILWLTDREGSGSDTISPSLEGMIFTLEDYIDTNPKSVILLDGVEYLISNNTFNPVLRFIRRIVDKVSETESLLLVALTSGTIGAQETKQIERELQPLYL